MIDRAYISLRGTRKLYHEEALVASELELRGIPCEFYTIKKIRRRQLPLTLQTLVVGDMDCLYGALKQLGAPIPTAESYPESLRSYLYRKVWRSTLGIEEARFRESSPEARFIKPAGRQKCFTGFIAASEYDFQQVYGVSRREPVYCSELVEWKSEFRVYVVKGEIRSVDCYDGDPSAAPDTTVLENAIQHLSESGQSYAGYGMDFGVLSGGETALVELNDGFALGAYSIAAADYTDLLIARWNELMQRSNNPDS